MDSRPIDACDSNFQRFGAPIELRDSELSATAEFRQKVRLREFSTWYSR